MLVCHRKVGQGGDIREKAFPSNKWDRSSLSSSLLHEGIIKQINCSGVGYEHSSVHEVYTASGSINDYLKKSKFSGGFLS